jgi:hypothetical protein
MSNLTQMLKYFQTSKKVSSLDKWRKWARQILRRKNVTVDLSICAYGNEQLIEKVRPFGGGYLFWSKACGGCPIGRGMLKLVVSQRRNPQEILDAPTHCVFLESGLLTRDAVKPGQVYQLPPVTE